MGIARRCCGSWCCGDDLEKEKRALSKYRKEGGGGGKSRMILFCVSRAGSPEKL